MAYETDGLSQFIDELLLNPTAECVPVQKAFLASYTGEKVHNQFTKVKMNLEADTILLNYFKTNLKKIESWFNIISPKERTLDSLKKELVELKNKDWRTILA